MMDKLKTLGKWWTEPTTVGVYLYMLIVGAIAAFFVVVAAVTVFQEILYPVWELAIREPVAFVPVFLIVVVVPVVLMVRDFWKGDN